MQLQMLKAVIQQKKFDGSRAQHPLAQRIPISPTATTAEDSGVRSRGSSPASSGPIRRR